MDELGTAMPLEDVWARLGTHLEWSEDFSLVFLFTNDPIAAEQLGERSVALLDGRRSIRAWRCAEPREVDAMVDAILAGPVVDVHWIDWVRFDDAHGQPGWARAWARLLLRLNERRELLRRRAPHGGLVFVTTLDRIDACPASHPISGRSAASCFGSRACRGRARSGSTAWRSPILRARGASRRATSSSRIRPSLRRGRAATSERSRRRCRASRMPRSRRTRSGCGARRLSCGGSWSREPSAKHRRELAAELVGLGLDCAAIGQREDALELTREALELARMLASEQPDAFLPDLARSLNNLGKMLSELGRREEAEAATREALEVYRGLAKARPDAFLPDLARSLNNLGKMLSDLGRREEAEAATREALEVYRGLAKARPDAFLPDLARSLNNLGKMLSDLGRREEAEAALEGWRRRGPTRSCPPSRGRSAHTAMSC